MAIKSLKDVYIHQLQDMRSANKQSLEVTRAMKDVANNSDLATALGDGAAGIEDGVSAVEALLRAHGADVDGEHCKGMEGLVEEARAHALKEQFDDQDAQDAVIITQYQRMAHYAIAGYGCLVAFARRLGAQDDAAKLQSCLDACYDGDRRMTAIATGEVNAEAV